MFQREQTVTRTILLLQSIHSLLTVTKTLFSVQRAYQQAKIVAVNHVTLLMHHRGTVDDRPYGGEKDDFARRRFSSSCKKYRS